MRTTISLLLPAGCRLLAREAMLDEEKKGDR